MRGIELTWAGGEHHFVLEIDHLRALQRHCDAGPMWVLNRLTSGQWMIDDIIQPIRLGLEGGGLSKEEAGRLVSKFVQPPLASFVLPARAILAEAIIGADPNDADDDAPGEQNAPATDGAEHSHEEN